MGSILLLNPSGEILQTLCSFRGGNQWHGGFGGMSGGPGDRFLGKSPQLHQQKWTLNQHTVGMTWNGRTFTDMRWHAGNGDRLW